MMACPPAFMEQECKLLDLLEQVESYTVDDTDTLTLTTATGETVTARKR